MLGDLTRDDWLNSLGLSVRHIPEVLILRGTRNLGHYYEQYKLLFENVIEVGSPNAVFEDLLIGERHGHTMAYASVYGAPMSSEIVHWAGVLGCKSVILTGCCGALAPDLQAGDLILPTRAYRGDGASQYYMPKLPDSDLLDWAHADVTLVRHTHPGDSSSGVPVKDGPIYTTSALFAETGADIVSWRDMGCIAVDMETAAVYTVAEAFGMSAMALLFVFDSPADGSHILMEESHKTELRRRGETEMIRLAVATADLIASTRELI